MNVRQWTALVCALTASGLAYTNPIPITAASQRQQSSVTMSAGALQQPLWLSVRAPGARLDGRVTLNGRHLATLGGSNLRMDLAPRLSPGRHRLLVRGTVRPPNGSVTLELRGAGLQVSQQASGSSQFDREIVLRVR